jgi:hypothetical protein
MFNLFKKKRNQFEEQVLGNIRQMVGANEAPDKAYGIISKNLSFLWFLAGYIHAHVDFHGEGLSKDEKTQSNLNILTGIFPIKGDKLVELFTESTDPMKSQGVQRGYQAACFILNAKSCDDEKDYGKALIAGRNWFSTDDRRNLTETEIASWGFILIWFTLEYQKEMTI